jgi:hypothetical protein
MTSKKSAPVDQDPVFNPLELVEDVILDQNWPCQRLNFYEILSEVEGRWGGYRILFLWQEEINVLHFACLLDVPLDSRNLQETYELLTLINERLAIGHFEIYQEEGLPAFRYSFLVNHPRNLQAETLEEIIDIAVHECEKFFPAFQFVLTGEKKAKEATSVAILDTVGEA